MEKSNGRILNLDVARILAVLAVVMIHTSADFVIVYDSATAEFFWGNICDSISRIGVPLFLMISGALMLDENREISMESLVKKNMKGIALLLIFWSFIYDIRYQIIPPLMHGEALGMKSAVTSFLYGHYHMWYLYMIIGMYFITPYLRCIVRYENRNMVLCFIGLGLLVQFTKPMINGLTSIWPSFAIFSKFIDKFNLIYMREISSYAMLVTGAKFIVKSAVAMVTFSSFLEIFAPIVDVTNEHLLAVCFGGVFLGAGVGFVIRAGGCLDGTETVLFINVVIYSIAGFLFGFDRAMYSLLTYFITSKVIDFVESGVEQAKAAMIITDEGQMIEEGGCRMRHPFLYFISA